MDDSLNENHDRKRETLERYSAAISDKKDRAQVSSTSALSVGLIALLKNMLYSPSDSPFYIVSLLLVSTAIALQIVVGFLAIAMMKCKSEVTDTIDKLSDRSWSTIVDTITQSGADKNDGDDETMAVVGEDETCCCSGTQPEAAVDLVDSIEGIHQSLKQQLRQNILDVIAAEVKLVNTDHKNKELVDAAREELGRQKALLKLTLSQLHVHYQAEQLVVKSRYLRRVDRYQTVISYLLYITFVLNAFLVGFGNVEA